jgi:uncharacterized protein
MSNQIAPPSFADFEVLRPYNRWWGDLSTAFNDIPSFKRDVFESLLQDIQHLPQMVSLTGPRRVGKSTLLTQCVQHIVSNAADPQAQAKRIVYFSMQDPTLELPRFDSDAFFNQLVATAVALSSGGAVYLFLDEIQRFPRWELYLKKYYDLKTPVRFIVSGSASAPIFKKSRESLLGRIKDFHVLPFSFREWYKLRVEQPRTVREEVPELMWSANIISSFGQQLQLERDSANLILLLKTFLNNDPGVTGLRFKVDDYFYDGGFPEVWALPTQLAKQEYLYQNQVQRVIYEDLLLAAEFRKPEMLRRFYLGLLNDPGRETNLTQVSKNIGITRNTIESYFPLLEATDLVWRLHKHTSTKSTPKAGNFKTYLVDLAVRNAVMKLSQEAMVADSALMGHYAENVVANHLRRWPGLVELGYWRDGNEEMDFIVDLGYSRIAVEVKYRNEIQTKDAVKALKYAKKLGCSACIVVSKQPLDTDNADLEKLLANSELPLAIVPLAAFLMLF